MGVRRGGGKPGPANFKETDVTKILRAAAKAKVAARVEVNPATGMIVVIPSPEGFRLEPQTAMTADDIVGKLE